MSYWREPVSTVTTANPQATTGVVPMWESMAEQPPLPPRRCSTEDSSFLACRPAVWFAQVEAQFLNQGVAQQQTRFDYVVAALAPDVPTEVRDLNLHSPVEQPYDRLKETLIQRTEASEQRWLH